MLGEAVLIASRATIGRTFVFHHFPFGRCSVVDKCRRSSALGFTRGSLGSFYTAIVRRPLASLACRLYTTKRLHAQSGHFPYFPKLLKTKQFSREATVLPFEANFVALHKEQLKEILRTFDPWLWSRSEARKPSVVGFDADPLSRRTHRSSRIRNDVG